MIATTRIWALICGAAAVALLAGGFLLGVQPQVAAAAAANGTAAAAEAQNQTTQAKLTALSKAAARMDSLQAENATLLKSVPSVLKPNTFIRRVEEVAALDGVQLISVSPTDAVPYAAPQAQAGSGGAAALGITSPLISAANLAAVPVTVLISGSEDTVLQFAHDMQNDERTFEISSVQTSKDDETSTVTGTLSGYIYVLKR